MEDGLRGVSGRGFGERPGSGRSPASRSSQPIVINSSMKKNVMAFGLNRVELIDRLGTDVTVNHLTSGDHVANLSIATDESFLIRQTDEKVDRTEWNRVVTFQNRLIDMFENHLGKSLFDRNGQRGVKLNAYGGVCTAAYFRWRSRIGRTSSQILHTKTGLFSAEFRHTRRRPSPGIVDLGTFNSHGRDPGHAASSGVGSDTHSCRPGPGDSGGLRAISPDKGTHHLRPARIWPSAIASITTTTKFQRSAIRLGQCGHSCIPGHCEGCDRAARRDSFKSSP